MIITNTLIKRILLNKHVYTICKNAYPMEELSSILVLSNNHGNNSNDNTNKNGNIDNNNKYTYPNIYNYI